MKILSRSNFVAALLGAVLAVYAQASAAPLLVQSSMTGLGASSYVPGEVLVKFRPSVIAQERTATVSTLGHTVLAHLDQPGWVHVKLGPGQSVAEALATYQNDPNVEIVQPNYIYHITAVPNDPQYGQLWAFKNTGQTVGTFPPNSGTVGDDMNIEPAWDQITDCSSVVVAVIDSGVNYKQEDLAANMWNGGMGFPNHGFDYVDNDDDPMDLNGHGTHVAGIIGAVGNNAKGAAGVCWKASIMAVRVLNAAGTGTTASISQGINFAVAHGAKVINMSLGGGGALSDQAFSDSISNAKNNDVVVVVAAGNATSNNDITAFYPCNFTQPNLVCVAALDQNFALASFSNWGATSVDVGAPGTNILSSFAGTVATTTDPLLTTSWTVNHGWTHVINNTQDFLVDPGNFLITKYGPNLNDTATKGFNTSAANAVILNFGAAVNLANSGDSFVAGVDPSGADPFGAGALQDGIAGPVDTGGSVFAVSMDISSCAGKNNCLIGFKLATGPTTPGDFGIGITQFSINALTLTTSTYQIENGTSMATPEVAGLAAMLRAYNPQYTYSDTVNAIKNGGRSVAALAGKTTTGKAVDVMSSLAYVNPPTGLAATVQ